MILFVPSLLLFALFTPRFRPLLWSGGAWVALGLGALCCLPILIWNVQHDWVGLFHVQTLAGVRSEASRVRWLGPLAYVGIQFALLLGFWFIVWARAMWDRAPWKDTSGEEKYLWWMSATTFLLFLGFSFTTGGGEANWAIAAYLSGMVLAAGWLQRRLKTDRRSMWGVRGIAAASVAGVALCLLALQPNWTLPTLRIVAGPPTAEQPLPLTRWDPTRRLRGWRTLAAEVDKEVALLRMDGVEPLIASGNLQVPGELGFYCREHPPVYSFGLAFNARHSQYDFWHPNPLHDPEPFLGRTFVYVDAVHPLLKEAFETVEPSRLVVYEEQGYPVSMWSITVCRGFKGFPREKWQQNNRY
jgi:hypothetical protein